VRTRRATVKTTRGVAEEDDVVVVRGVGVVKTAMRRM
jgi:hypothetical protein